MRFLSLFSGIEAASEAWLPLGWTCVAVAEIEPFPCAALAHHHPKVPNLGDVTKITAKDIAALGPIDLVVFGSPCQDLSLAGKRAGFKGERSGLFHTAMRIVHWARDLCGCRFALWENVPGAFSSNKGRDFAAVVEQMAGSVDVTVPAEGWGNEGLALGDDALLEWSTLDAQWFGLAQRRQRVFALADFGDWADRPPILLEPESLRGDSAPRREAGESVAADAGCGFETAGTLDARVEGGGFPGSDGACSGHVVPVAFGQNRQSGPVEVSHAMNAHSSPHGRLDFESETFLVQPALYSIMPQNSGKDYKARVVEVAQPLLAGGPTNGNQGGDFIVQSVTGDISHALNTANNGKGCSEDGTGRGVPTIAVPILEPGARTGKSTDDPRAGLGIGDDGDPMFTLQAGKQHGVATGLSVRRLTPRECERLQGFPDDHTQVPYRGKRAADGPRYKAIGNSMAVNVMAWIGRSIEAAIAGKHQSRSEG